MLFVVKMPGARDTVLWPDSSYSLFLLISLCFSSAFTLIISRLFSIFSTLNFSIPISSLMCVFFFFKRKKTCTHMISEGEGILFKIRMLFFNVKHLTEFTLLISSKTYTHNKRWKKDLTSQYWSRYLYSCINNSKANTIYR